MTTGFAATTYRSAQQDGEFKRATPSFLLAGDGGLSSYRIFIDGISIGTFNSDGFGNVCIFAPSPLPDGTHVLTGNELAPHSTYTVTPFNFSVDTVPPATPSTPVLAAYSDSGVQGDNITAYHNVTLLGTSDPSVQILLTSGTAGIGGALADGTGHWAAATTYLADGTYVIGATASDTAGNKSASLRQSHAYDPVLDANADPDPGADTDPDADSDSDPDTQPDADTDSDPDTQPDADA